MNLLQAAITLFSLCIINFWLGSQSTNKKGFGYPPFLFCVLWLFMILLHWYFRHTYLPELYPLTERVLLIFTLGGLTASMAGGLQHFVFYKFKIGDVFFKSNYSNENPVNKKNDALLKFRLVLTILSCLFLPLYVFKILNLGKDGISDNLFVNIRYSMVVDEVDVGIVGYTQTFALFVFSVQFLSMLLFGGRINKWLFAINLLIIITYTFFSTGRGYYLFVFAVLFGIQAAIGRISRKMIVIALSCFILIFILVGTLLNKVNINADSDENFVTASMFAIGIYSVVPLNAFDYEVNQNGIFKDHGMNTLRFFYAVAEKTGLYDADETSKKLVQQFVFVPYPCNVYTMYSPYYRDFGITIAFVFIFILFYLHSWLYYKAGQKKNWAILGYSFLVFPLVFSFFQDQYFSLFSTWIQVSLFVFIYTLVDYLVKKRIDA